jgi:predicted nucleotidyltransferase
MSEERRLATARILTVAHRLTTIREHLVFIGGTVLPLLVDVDDRFYAPRMTDDVDAVGVVANYAQSVWLERAVAAAGYRPDVRSRHKGRWVAEDGSMFDLSFTGRFAGASGSLVDELAVETAMAIHEDPSVRHVSPVGLFLMKCAAFHDRGQHRPADSKDLADLAVLMVGAPIVQQAEAMVAPVRREVTARARQLLEVRQLAVALVAHFADRHPIPPDSAEGLAEEAITTLQSLAESPS